MKKLLRHILLLPLSIVYGIITSVRNLFYDKGLLKSVTHKKAVISVGNLAVGGTGKTPHAEFIISLIKDTWRTAYLSRGYKRETKGFIHAHGKIDYREIGDEPFQIFRKIKNIVVVVDENRNKGIQMLNKLFPETEVIILDDAFQHRKLHPGLSILLTSHNELYTRDSLLPGGNLRESARGCKRADIIIVTKCPADLKPIEFRVIEHELRPELHQQIYFSTLKYDEPQPLFPEFTEKKWTFLTIKEKKASILLVTGIVNPKVIESYLSQYSKEIISLKYTDHHDFSRKDIADINKEFDKIQPSEKLILVTEKDAARLINHKYLTDKLKISIFVLPVKVQILDNKETLFIKKITDYVAENKGNN